MNVKFVCVFLFIATMLTGYECAANSHKRAAEKAVGEASAAKTCWDWKVKYANQSNILNKIFEGKKDKKHFDVFATCCVSICTLGADSCKNDCKKQQSARVNNQSVKDIKKLSNCNGEFKLGECSDYVTYKSNYGGDIW